MKGTHEVPEPDDAEAEPDDAEAEVKSKTFVDLASEEMERQIVLYLALLEHTDSLANITPDSLSSVDERRMVLAGLGATEDALDVSAEFVAEEAARRKSVQFDVETAITTAVYLVLRERAAEQLELLARDTKQFTNVTPEYIVQNAGMLPLLMRIAGIFSKAELKRLVGSASDRSISKRAAAKLAELVKSQVDGPEALTEGEVLRGLEATLEGIMRGLVGGVLLESLVENALTAKGLTFRREADYDSLVGVVYDFRADFVLPDEVNPRAFIEVRKSSSRHASLYAKDKMFSAINWKGKHREMLAILVTDGPWTQATLKILPKVFDYVVPMTELAGLAATLKAYIDGDKTKLKWLIDFSIRQPD